MEIGHLKYLEHKTRTFQVITSTLWDYLGDFRMDNSNISSLLYQIHNCLTSGLVEQVISNRLDNCHLIWSNTTLEKVMENPCGNEMLLDYSNARLQTLLLYKPIIPKTVTEHNQQLTEKQGEAFKKFELLWQLSPQNMQEPDCGFERVLFKMYDALSLPLQTPIRSVVIKWLQDSLLKGDIVNLMKPLLKILLSMQTRRISLLHAVALRKGGSEDDSGSIKENGLENSNKNEYESIKEKDLFAVSTIGEGHSGVRYRTEAISQKKKSPKSLRIFGVPIIPKTNFVRSPGFGSDKKSPASLPVSTRTMADDDSK